jgi:hypothetical protein
VAMAAAQGPLSRCKTMEDLRPEARANAAPGERNGLGQVRPFFLSFFTRCFWASTWSVFSLILRGNRVFAHREPGWSMPARKS